MAVINSAVRSSGSKAALTTTRTHSTTAVPCTGRLSPPPPSIVTALVATVAVMLYRRPPSQNTSTLLPVTMPCPVESVATPVSLSVRVVRLPALPAATDGFH